jgi:hypothetical protein
MGADEKKSGTNRMSGEQVEELRSDGRVRTVVKCERDGVRIASAADGASEELRRWDARGPRVSPGGTTASGKNQFAKEDHGDRFSHGERRCARGGVVLSALLLMQRIDEILVAKMYTNGTVKWHKTQHFGWFWRVLPRTRGVARRRPIPCSPQGVMRRRHLI